MFARRLARRILALGSAFEGAAAAAQAVEAGHRPSRAALGKLGIAPDAFDGVRMR